VFTESPLAGDEKNWYKFDDKNVSVFFSRELSTLEGGGEDPSAYVLLYKSRSIEQAAQRALYMQSRVLFKVFWCLAGLREADMVDRRGY